MSKDLMHEAFNRLEDEAQGHVGRSALKGGKGGKSGPGKVDEVADGEPAEPADDDVHAKMEALVAKLTPEEKAALRDCLDEGDADA